VAATACPPSLIELGAVCHLDGFAEMRDDVFSSCSKNWAKLAVQQQDALPPLSPWAAEIIEQNV
jgi:hypothetical protein